MHKGFIEYCPECLYHTDWHELSILSAIRQVDEDWGAGHHCMTICPICGEPLKDWYGDGEPVTTGPFRQRKISEKFMEVINDNSK